MMRVLVLGATGMLGSTLMREFTRSADLEARGTCRSAADLLDKLPPRVQEALIEGVDVERIDTVRGAIDRFKPDVAINCIGIIKQLPLAKKPVPTITINTLFPHQLAEICSDRGVRLIHVGTDCVFSGNKGRYSESDLPDATDLYGKSKALGEVDYGTAVTLRAPFIGHELRRGLGLLEWFLAQRERVQGYTGAIYSGLPTVELANVIKNSVLPNSNLRGLYQISSEPISKYDLLKLVAAAYQKDIQIDPVDRGQDNKSLDSSRFREATGYVAPRWPELIQKMRAEYVSWQRDLRKGENDHAFG